MDEEYAKRTAEALEAISNHLKNITEDIHWILQVLEDRL